MSLIADWFEYAEFDGDVCFYWFGLKMPALGKFQSKNQNCLW